MFAPIETSRTQGAPIWLYRFHFGGREFCYTSFEREIVHSGSTYAVKAIKHDSPKASGNLDKSSLRVTAQRDMDIRDLFLIWPPSTVVNLTIRVGHDGDPDEQFLVCWSGRVLSFERNGSESIMQCQPISTSMRQPGLRFPYSIMCPHYLYGPECGASRAAATVYSTVVSMSGFNVTLPAGWNAAFPVGKFAQGDARWTNLDGEPEIRTIMSVSVNTLRLSGALIGMIAGTSIAVALGCNHKTGGEGDCTTLHNNGMNYGGCKWIPLKNPVSSNNFR
jgi:hypothetical protein